MEYFKLLNLTREPFSNSPDPAFFYESDQHKDCLQKLEIALRLRRGLNVVTGEVGTGKTTLCRQMIQTFSDDPRISACLILDPDFPDPCAFLGAVVHMMTGFKPAPNDTLSDMKEKLKHYLFQKGVEEDRTVVLIIDEGQKMPPACLETLRELLNFETNEYKLLQIIIFAQNEFADTLNAQPNLADRINLYVRLKPLSFGDFRAFIRHRLQSAANPENTAPRLFSMPALWRIYRASGGYPRKIIHLCHQCLLTMIIQNKTTVRWRISGACARRTFGRPRILRPVPVSVTLFILAMIAFGAWQYTRGLRHAHVAVESRADNTVVAASTEKPPGSEAQTARPTPNVAETLPASAVAASTENKAPSPPSPMEASKLETEPASLPLGGPIQKEAVSGEAPPLLGRVPVAVGDTLGGLLQKVYGAYTYRHHQAVMAANPQLTDPDSLRIGESLNFPAISADMNAVPDSTWWVSLSREPNLMSAVVKLRETKAGDFPLRLLVLQSPGKDFVFRIVLKTCFENEHLAKRAKEQLELPTQTISEVFCLRKGEATAYGSIGI